MFTEKKKYNKRINVNERKPKKVNGEHNDMKGTTNKVTE